ncbi:MAG: hypothetical protein GY856_29405 [bacterium]|nr:hypothetical protein [bacterium]
MSLSWLTLHEELLRAAPGEGLLRVELSSNGVIASYHTDRSVAGFAAPRILGFGAVRVWPSPGLLLGSTSEAGDTLAADPIGQQPRGEVDRTGVTLRACRPLREIDPMLTMHTMPVEEIRGTSIEEILNSVVADQTILTVKMPGGTEVLIQPKVELQPLPVLDGFVPQDWKDAVYNEPDGSGSL